MLLGLLAPQLDTSKTFLLENNFFHSNPADHPISCQVTSGAFIQGIVEHGRERSTKNYNRSKPLSRVSGGVAKRGRTCCSPSHNFHQHQPSRSVEDPFLSNGAAGSVSAGGEMEATVGGQAAGGSAFFGAAFSTISGSDAPRAHTNGSWLGGYTPEASGVGDRRCDG